MGATPLGVEPNWENVPGSAGRTTPGWRTGRRWRLNQKPASRETPWRHRYGGREEKDEG